MKKVAIMMSLVAVSAQGFLAFERERHDSTLNSGVKVGVTKPSVSRATAYLALNQAILRCDVRGKIAAAVDTRLAPSVLNKSLKIALTSAVDSAALTTSVFIVDGANTFTPRSIVTGLFAVGVVNSALTGVEALAANNKRTDDFVASELYQAWIRPAVQFTGTYFLADTLDKIGSQGTPH